MSDRLSTCGICGGTMRGWQHITETDRTRGHRADPDDSWVSGPDGDDLCTCAAGFDPTCLVHGGNEHRS